MRYIVVDLAKTPKVQVERAVGPILGLFIAEAFSAKFHDVIEVVCPEFPLRKNATNSNQSTNLDWLLYAKNRNMFVFVELKTTDTTYREEQKQIYDEVIKRIKSDKGQYLATNVKTIMQASREWGKYAKVLASIEQPCYGNCEKAALVYLAPKCAHRPDQQKPIKSLDDGIVWLSFKELPEDICSPFASEWKVVRKWLTELDDITRRSRNDQPEDANPRNFQSMDSFDRLLQRCGESPDGIVVGFDGGPNRLKAATLDELNKRSFKWDYATDGRGRKDARNWVSGRTFLAHVAALDESRT